MQQHPIALEGTCSAREHSNSVASQLTYHIVNGGRLRRSARAARSQLLELGLRSRELPGMQVR